MKMKPWEILLLAVAGGVLIAAAVLYSQKSSAQSACPTGSMVLSDSGVSSCGPIPSLTIGTTVTGTPGSPVSVTNTGGGPNPVLNFTIPSGLGGSNGTNGTNGTNGAAGSPGAAGIVCYNASGAITGCKQWIGTATVNSSGNWSVNVSSAGFSNVLWSQFSGISAANGGFVTVSSGTCNATTCSGTATGALNVLGILTLSLNNINGSIISVQVVGN